MLAESVLDAIGNTPLVRLALPGPGRAYAKLEMQNLFAMKDRVARQMVLDARERGLLAPGAPIIESSSGTMALGLALVGAALGHPVHIVTDPRIDEITHAKLTSLGCAVHVVGAMTGAGWQSARLEKLAELLDGLPGAFWPQQYSNPQNPAAYRVLAAELAADLERVDVVVGSVGSGGSLCGTSRALRERWPDVRVVAVDCVGSMIFGQPDWPQRRQSGLGNSMQPANVDYGLFDEVHWLSDDEAFAATRQLAREQQIFAGNTAGSVYQVLRHVAAHALEGTTVVGILPDRGDRYVGTVYAGEVVPAGEPVEVGYGTAVTRWSYARLPRRRPRLLFLESNTTGTGMLALRTARRLGADPVLLTGDPSRYLGLDGTGAAVTVVDSTAPDALAAAVAELAGSGPLAGITTTSEYFLQPAAELATACAVPGNPPAALGACRDKAATRAALAAAGLAQPRHVVVLDVGQVAAAVAEVGLPCVVKPLTDSGSHDVLRCEDVAAAEGQVRRVLAVTVNGRGQPTPRAVLVEEYVEGPEVSVELVLIDGTPHCVGVTAKTVGAAPYFVETQHIFPAPLPEPDQAAIVDYARQAVAATGLRTGAVHVELRLTPTGPRLIEINARLAGGMIPELVRLATGIDLLEQHLRCVLALPVTLTPTRGRVAGIRFLVADRVGVLRGVSGAAQARRSPGVDRVVVTAAVGADVRPARDFADRLGYVIAVGDDAAEVQTILDAAAAPLTVDVDSVDVDSEDVA